MTYSRGRKGYMMKSKHTVTGLFAVLLALLLLVPLPGCKKRSDRVATRTAPTQRPTTIPADIEAAVIKIVAEQMGVAASGIKRSTHLKSDLKTDDLDRVELIMELEDTFQLSINDSDAEKLLTVGQMVDYVRTHLRR